MYLFLCGGGGRLKYGRQGLRAVICLGFNQGIARRRMQTDRKRRAVTPEPTKVPIIISDKVALLCGDRLKEMCWEPRAC